MEKIEIKKAKISDLDYIINGIYNIRSLEKTIFNKIKPEAILEKEFVNHIKEEINLDSYFIRILEENGEKAGMIIGKITDKNPVWDYELYSVLNYLFIGEKFRKKGYAEKLCKDFFKWAKEKGSDRVTLSGMIGNKGAYKLYEKLGFEEVVFMMGKDL